MSTLQVENLIGPTSGSNANKVIIPSGQTLDASNGFVAPAGSVVNYQSYRDTTLTVLTSSSFSTVYTFPTYTPTLNNSTVVYKFNLLARGYRNSGQDARAKLKFVVDGFTVITDNEFGNYDYGGHGIWWRYVYSSGYSHNNTDGSSISAYMQLANLGTELEYNSNDGSSATQSFYEIMEIAQ